MAGASKTLKITHLDLACEFCWARLGCGDSGAKAWACFPAPWVLASGGRVLFGDGLQKVALFLFLICFVHLHAVPLGFRLP